MLLGVVGLVLPVWCGRVKVDPFHTVFAAIYLALDLFVLLLVGRLVMDYVMMFARRWRPAKWPAVALEVVWSVTDPPLQVLRRVIPPLRIGSMSLDLGFIILFLVAIVLMKIVGALAV